MKRFCQQIRKPPKRCKQHFSLSYKVQPSAFLQTGTQTFALLQTDVQSFAFVVQTGVQSFAFVQTGVKSFASVHDVTCISTTITVLTNVKLRK